MHTGEAPLSHHMESSDHAVMMHGCMHGSEDHIGLHAPVLKTLQPVWCAPLISACHTHVEDVDASGCDLSDARSLDPASLVWAVAVADVDDDTELLEIDLT